MCGIFGYVGKVPEVMLMELALLAESRGPHAFGLLYWKDGLHICKETGKIGNKLAHLQTAVGAAWMIGHCRLATSGNQADVNDTQPLLVDGQAIAHNGNVNQYTELYEGHGYTPYTANDSEALLMLLASQAITMDEVHKHSQPAAVAYYDGKTISLCSTGQPLYLEQTENYHAFCSRKFGNASKLGNDIVNLSI
jgi:glutamine phosphoribosylpyrophosphate amidotransferase